MSFPPPSGFTDAYTGGEDAVKVTRSAPNMYSTSLMSKGSELCLR